LDILLILRFSLEFILKWRSPLFILEIIFDHIHLLLELWNVKILSLLWSYY
jgi:hypothetical protein